MKHRPTLRRVATPAFARSSRAALAVVISAGVVFHSSAHPTIAQDSNESVEDYLADLVGDVSEAEAAVADTEGKLGTHREQANKARVDLDIAQQQAQAAQNEVLSARDRLTASDKEVASAQKRLDNIARSTYSAGGSASAINLAAGQDSVRDTLDRASYLHLAAEKQRSEVNRLDLARTQNANEESRLRSSRAAANEALYHAKELYAAAEQAVVTAQQTLDALMTRYQQLIKEQEASQARLRAAKSAIDKLANHKPKATSFEKRRVAEAAANKAADEPNLDTATVESTTESTETTQQETTATPTSTDTSQAKASSTVTSVTSEPTEANDPLEAEAEETTTTDAPVAPSTASAEFDSFDESSEGDDQRQQAINGLVEAGAAGFMTGFGSLQNGGGMTQAISDGAAATRQHAGNAYDEATGAYNSEGTTAVTTTTAATTASAGSTSVPTTTTSAATATSTATSADAATDTATNESTSASTTAAATATTTSDASTTDTSTASGTAASGSASEQIEQVINRGMSQLGVTYAWGGGNWHGPTLGIRDGGVADSHGDYNKVGFDCSGLMMYAFYAVGIQLQHYSGYQYTAGRQVPVSEAKRGDMLFWGPGGSQHVALYLGNDQMLEAPNSGSTVRVSSVRWNSIQPYAVRMIE